MKPEYDSRKNCASQMKRKLVFFSVSHFAIPLPTVNCQLSTVNWTHTFSAKEKDSETGLSYFGSRYYSSDLSIWLSVDPMSDKYPSLSPYVYCANNPIKLVDPNGEEIRIYYGNGNKYVKYTPGMKAKKRYDSFVKDAINGLNFLYKNPQGDNNRVDYVATKTGEIVRLYQGTPGETSKYSPEKKELYWDNQSIDVFEGGSQSPIISLAHELDHADRTTKAWDAYNDCKKDNPGIGDSPCDTYIEQARGLDVDAAEASAIEYENYVGGLSYNGKKLSSYNRKNHSEIPIRQVKAPTIFSYEE